MSKLKKINPSLTIYNFARSVSNLGLWDLKTFFLLFKIV